ncbi:hypothetical protein INO37_13530, partial [Staphylococcus aureus]|nr:hypothetical protein [Staphylococcus aureus]
MTRFFDDRATIPRSVVAWAYENILGRPPEDPRVLDAWAAQCAEVQDLLYKFLTNEEFGHRSPAEKLKAQQAVKTTYKL